MWVTKSHTKHQSKRSRYKNDVHNVDTSHNGSYFSLGLRITKNINQQWKDVTNTDTKQRGNSIIQKYVGRLIVNIKQTTNNHTFLCLLFFLKSQRTIGYNLTRWLNRDREEEIILKYADSKTTKNDREVFIIELTWSMEIIITVKRYNWQLNAWDIQSNEDYSKH